MSLQNLAQQIQSRGRGDDSVLVHMTPHEVGGLQALALAHGGSLTVNPETGLPEAGFLSSLLPMVAGALLAPMTAGTSLAWMGSPMGAALTVGGLTGLATGSLNKGLMAGLGAFGGAGLGAGLMGAGANAATTGAVNATKAIQQAPIFAPGSTGALEAAKGSIIGANPAGVMTTTGPSSAYTGGFSTVQTPIPTTATSAFTPQQLATPTVTQMPSGFEAFKGGIKAIADNPIEGIKSVYANMPPYTGVASLASTAMGMQPEYKAPKQSKSLIRPYRLDRRYEQSGLDDTGYGTSERRYFDYAFTPETPYEAPGPEYAAGGGLMGATSFDDGGYVRYTGTRPLDQYKDDYYYVSGGIGPGYYMYKPQYGPGSGSPSGEYDPTQGTGPYKYDYDPATGKFTQQAGPGTPSATTPKLSTDPQAYTAEMLNPVYQQYFGRDVDPEGIAAYTARQFAPSELDTILKASPEYAARQQQLAAAKKEASYATKAQAANLYSDLLGRTIDPEGLKHYTEENRMTPADLKKTLMASEEYATKLTKPLAPRPFVTHSGAIGLEGAMRTPEQEAARPRDMSGFYAMMNQRLQEQAQRQPQYAVGGPVEQMSAANAVGDNLMYPQAQYQTSMYSNPMIQRPMPANVITQGLDAPVDQYTGEQRLAGGGHL